MTEYFDFLNIGLRNHEEGALSLEEKSGEIGVTQVANVFNFIRDKDDFDGNSQESRLILMQTRFT